jgi:hypothetical protein
MGAYSEYLDQSMGFDELTAERKKQLGRIRDLRGGRDILVYAADLRKLGAPIAIVREDLLPIQDQLANLSGDCLDFVIETPGGLGEVAEDIVHLIRGRYERVAVIVPGVAKSAGTIMTMAGDEILMEPASALGPIDAQLSWQGKTFSAQALLDGMEKIKTEVDETNRLNRAYIPILNNISPGELQSAENALAFAKTLVRDWLARYKFRTWERHSSTGAPVTDEEKRTRAQEIAAHLCDHAHWLTHGRSIRIDDLQEMRLKITDYSRSPDLADALRRYHILLQMTFETHIYKIFETVASQIYRFVIPQAQGPIVPKEADVAIIDVECGKCKGKTQVQANLAKHSPAQSGTVPFPPDNKFRCPRCGNPVDLSGLRREVEAQTRRKIVQ